MVNIIKSHSCGVGNPLTPERTRMLLALRIHEISLGHSLISVDTFKKYIHVNILIKINQKAFNLDILPYVPEEGSSSCADTPQLGHLILGLLGFG